MTSLLSADFSEIWENLANISAASILLKVRAIAGIVSLADATGLKGSFVLHVQVVF